MARRNARHRILVVEDDGDFRVLLSDVLRMNGHQCAEVSTALDAVATLATFLPEVVMLASTVDRPTEDLIAAIRAWSHTAGRSVVVVGMGYEPLEIEGLDHCLVKPFHSDQLEAVLALHDEESGN